MFETLYQYIQPLIQLTPAEKRVFEGVFTYKQVPKNYILADAGKVCNELFFINKGLIRLYYHKEGDEITGFIFKEGLFAASFESFLTGNPGTQTLETIEDCDLLVTNATYMEKLYAEIPKINVLTRKIAEQRFLNAQQILSSYILDSPEERYLKFEAKHKDLLMRVPQHMIASFLGITPVSLSRIRKRIAEGN